MFGCFLQASFEISNKKKTSQTQCGRISVDLSTRRHLGYPIQMHVSIAEPIRPDVASHAGAEFFCDHIERLDSELASHGGRVLIAGCGAGHEAALIQSLLGAETYAVDVDDFMDEQYTDWPNLHYEVASVTALPFEDSCFDAIFYHHVIEHVDDPAASLTELSRALKPGGWMFLGTPNRHRIISSVGAHKQSTWEPNWRNKIKDNVDVYAARLTRRFHNQLGAHAGFSRKELSTMLMSDFSDQWWVTNDYLRYKYRDHKLKGIMPLMGTRWFENLAAPSIYVFAKNGK